MCSTVLITEPADCILQKLARLVEQKSARVVYLDGRLASGGAGSVERRAQESLGTRADLRCAKNEVWHASNPLHSFEESREAAEQVLAFMGRNKIPRINYVSSLLALGQGGWQIREAPLDPARTVSSGVQRHRFVERAIETSGFSFRIYRIPPIFDGTPLDHHAWPELLRLLLRFKAAIEDRIPRYFEARPLCIPWSAEQKVSLISVDDAGEILHEIAHAHQGQHGYFHVLTQPPVPFGVLSEKIAELTGIRLETETPGSRLNYVDRLFLGQAAGSLDRLKLGSTFSVARTLEHSARARVRSARATENRTSFGAALSAAEAFEASRREQMMKSWSVLEKRQCSANDGTTLSYHIGGTGKDTIVLLNAYGQSFDYWKKVVGLMSRFARIILWLPRGNTWNTVGLARANSQATHADDLEALLAHEKVGSCTLLGWCRGPKLAIEYYSRYPRRIRSMVFVASSFKGPAEYKSLETDYEGSLEGLLGTIERQPQMAALAVEALKAVLLAQHQESLLADTVVTDSEDDIQRALSSVNTSLQSLVVQPFHSTEAVVEYAKQLRAFWSHEFLPVLSSITIPVLVVGGDCDKIASQAISKAIAARIPHGEYLEFAGGSHYIQYEECESLAEILRRIVAQDCLPCTLGKEDSGSSPEALESQGVTVSSG